MNYAVIKTGGKQYQVFEGKTLEIEKINAEVGQKITFDQVLLLICDERMVLGRPYIEKSKVEGEVLEQKKGKKIAVVKFKAKSRYRRKTGHRQFLTRVKITKISV